MQSNGADKKKIVLAIVPILLLILLLLADQITKTHVKNLAESSSWVKTTVIAGFFEFRYVMNTGAAFSFLANVTWGQLFFKILTSVALVLFFAYYVFVCHKGQTWARFAMIFIFAGTIGNFIDRLCYDGVVDFISLIFGTYNFPVFNLADAYMTVGVIMIIIQFLFVDENALFRKKKKDA